MCFVVFHLLFSPDIFTSPQRILMTENVYFMYKKKKRGLLLKKIQKILQCCSNIIHVMASVVVEAYS